MYLRRYLLSSAIAISFFVPPAFAADGQLIELRGSERKDATRLVFAGDHAAPYKVEGQGQDYRIVFSGEAVNISAAADLKNLSRIQDVVITKPNTVAIKLDKGQSISSFTVGDKIIVDVKGPPERKIEKIAKKPLNLAAAIEPSASANDKPVVQPEKKPETKTVTQPLADDVENIAEKVEKISPQIQVTKDNGKTDSEGNEAPAATAPAPVKKPPYVISVSSTSVVPMAAFMRHGYLWILQDRENAVLPPGLENMDGAIAEKIPAKGLSVFRIKLPEEKKLYASGGGLVWRMSSTFDGVMAPTALPPKSRFGHDSDKGPDILWAAKSVHRIAEFEDPESGDMLDVVFVNDAKDFVGDARNYAEVEIYPSIIGMVVRTKADDVKIEKIKDDGVAIGRPDGLALSPAKDIVTNKPEVPAAQKSITTAATTTTADSIVDSVSTQERIFDFSKSRIGTKNTVAESQRVIMSGLAEQTDIKRAENLLALGNLMLSFGYAHEAQGYFAFAVQTLPTIETSPEFMASRAAASALAGNSKEAFTIFSLPQFNGIDEIKLWKAMTLADLDDWDQAAAQVAAYLPFWEQYPDEIRFPVALAYAEVLLREGNADKAGDMLDKLEADTDKMDLSRLSAWKYLHGEFSRQKDDKQTAKDMWQELVDGQDDLYRSKARFALTTLKLDDKEITIDKAIDNLEGLRYAWRGDSLETAINYKLAKLYMQKGEPIKALTMMRLAQSLSPLSEMGKRIDADMHDTYKGLFAPDKIKNLSPIDAATLYSEFSDLAPAGVEGDVLSRQLAERLVDADLLPRAEKLLQSQIDGKVQGTEGADVAMRLASLQLLDDKGEGALKSLERAEEFLKAVPPDLVGARDHDIGMLKAKAYSLMDKPQNAMETLSLLPQDDDVLRLRADIAWRAKKWQDAADALEQILTKQDISLTRPLSEDQAATILNWAVALYLADNRYVLANVRERYSDAMSQTASAKKFDVITRPRQNALMADRETVQSIIDETSIFKDFLTTFKRDANLSAKGGSATTTSSSPEESGGQVPAQNIPEELKNSPLLKTDAVSTD